MAKHLFTGPCKLCCGDVEVEIVITSFVSGEAPQYATDAGRMIAALPRIRFPANRAGQLGNRCLAALSRFPTRQ